MSTYNEIKTCDKSQLLAYAEDLDIDIADYREHADVRNPGVNDLVVNTSDLRERLLDYWLSDNYDAQRYDVEAMQTDSANGNYDDAHSDGYLKVSIVEASLVNGQREQAIQQAKRYGMSVDSVLHWFKKLKSLSAVNESQIYDATEAERLAKGVEDNLALHSFKGSLYHHIETLKDLVNRRMKEGGPSCQESQLVCLRERITALEMYVNGIQAEDLK